MNKLKSRIKNQLTNATLAFMMKKDEKEEYTQTPERE